MSIAGGSRATFLMSCQVSAWIPWENGCGGMLGVLDGCWGAQSDPQLFQGDPTIAPHVQSLEQQEAAPFPMEALRNQGHDPGAGGTPECPLGDKGTPGTPGTATGLAPAMGEVTVNGGEWRWPSPCHQAWLWGPPVPVTSQDRQRPTATLL